MGVHGLDGGSLESWTSAETEKMWLREFLPQDIPSARIIAFDYEIALAFQSSGGMASTALSLLSSLIELRRSNEVGVPVT